MDAFKADKKAAADRVNELLDGKDDSEDETTTGLFLFNFAILKYLIPRLRINCCMTYAAI